MDYWKIKVNIAISLTKQFIDENTHYRNFNDLFLEITFPGLEKPQI